jgi:hypothetical protein
MEKIAYLRHLHDIAYQANLADTDRAEDWQWPGMAHHHAQPILDIIESMLSPEQYEIFLNCFGDFESFIYNLKRA